MIGLINFFCYKVYPIRTSLDDTMDLELLKTFITVNKTQHFGKAANDLFVTQSAISARIRLLESQLNCQLFLRDSKPLQLTEEGKKFIVRAEEIIQTWTLAKSELMPTSAVDNTLRIASHACLWQCALSTKLSSIEQPLQIRTIAHDKVWQSLDDQNNDIVISYKTAKPSHLIQQDLGHLELQLVGNKRSAAHFTLDSCAFIDLDWGPAFDQFKQRTVIHKMPCNLQSDNVSAVIHLLLKSNSCAFLPISFVQSQAQLQAIHHPAIADFSLSLQAFYHKHAVKKQHIEAALNQFIL